MMMASENTNPEKPAKDETQASSSGNRKPGPNAPLKPPEQALKCPRCDSSNTKFCYYNNYSLTQPRHFCKTCRRYWTKGGALRNVPIGGGCRKTKKITKSGSSSSSTSCRLSSGDSKLDYFSAATTDISNGLNFRMFQNLTHPAMDFQLPPSSLPRLQFATAAAAPAFGQFPSPIGDFGSCGADQIGGFMINNVVAAASPSVGFINSNNSNSNNNNNNNNSNHLASSIESLSCINQDLHWKLQQQRYAAMVFGGGGGDQDQSNTLQKAEAASSPGGGGGGGAGTHHQIIKPQITNLFQNLEVSRPQTVCGGASGTLALPPAHHDHEWFFDGNSAFTATAAVSAAPPSNGGASGSWSGGGGVQGWGDLQQQYSGLP